MKRPRQPGEPRLLIFVAGGDPRFPESVAGAATRRCPRAPDLKRPRVSAGARRKIILWAADGESNPDQALASDLFPGLAVVRGVDRSWITGIRPCALDGIDPGGGDHSPQDSILLEPLFRDGC